MKNVLNKILVAISGSDTSINAAKYGIMLAKSQKLELNVIYVVDTSTIQDLVMSKIFIQEESAEYENNLRENGKRYLTYAEELAQSKGVKIVKHLKSGAISTQILDTAEEIGADMILLGSWEINRSRRDLMSRFHTDIIMDAKMPVLIVKDNVVEGQFNRF